MKSIGFCYGEERHKIHPEVFMEQNYDALKPENQLCFPLYTCAREITKLYYPYLTKPNLTYTQYITTMLL
jgi:hypothetical protein